MRRQNVAIIWGEDLLEVFPFSVWISYEITCTKHRSVGRSSKLFLLQFVSENWKQTFLVDLFSLSAPKCFYVSWEGDPIFIFCIFCIFYFYSLNINILFMEGNNDFCCKAVDRGLLTWTFVLYNYTLICCYCYLVFWCQDNIHYNVMFM